MIEQLKPFFLSLKEGSNQPKKQLPWPSGGKGVVLLVCLLVGLFLIGFGGCKKEETGEKKEDLDGYLVQLEDRLCGLLDDMEGVSKSEVFVTLERGDEKVYTSRNDQLTATLQPEVKGVLVVCDGGGDEKKRIEIIESVATALGIGWNQVSVRQRG